MKQADLSRSTTPAASTGARMGPPGMPGGAGAGAKPRDLGGTLRRLLYLVLTEKAKLATILISTVISVLLGVLGPWLLGKATDLIVSAVSASSDIPFSQLARLLLLVAVMQVVAALFNWRRHG